MAKIESENEENSYPPHEWSKLAEELNCTVHDLLPPNQSNSTGELVDKVVLSPSNQADLTSVIEGLIANGFFDGPKTMDDIAKHLFREKKEQITVLESAIALILKEGKLKQEKDGFVH